MAAYALETGDRAEVTAICRSNYDVVKERGFNIDSLEHGHGIKGWRPSHILRHDHFPDLAKDREESLFEYVVVTTKDIADVPPTVVDIISPAIKHGHTTVVLLQNGLNIEKPILERFPNNVVLSGVSLISASEPTHGHIIHEFSDVLKVGPFPGLRVPVSQVGSSARRFVEMYNACGKVNCTYDDDVSYTRWKKLVYNSSFNSVSAILGMDVIRMRQTRHVIDDLIRPIMLEIIATAKAAGVDLPEGVDDESIMIDPSDDNFLPSMGQDAAKSNLMEVETIVGAPVREAERLCVPVPTLSMVYGLLKGKQVMIKEVKAMWQAEWKDGNPYR